jgi:hypothetical protein
MTDKKNTRSDHIATENPGEEIVRMDWDRYEQPALGIIEAVAGVTDRLPTDLPPLGNELDLDALNSLLSADKEDSEVKISFEYQGLVIRINQAGGLVVESGSRQGQ